MFACIIITSQPLREEICLRNQLASGGGVPYDEVSNQQDNPMAQQLAIFHTLCILRH